jgi:tryptophan-rich sensory protein
MVLNFGWTPVFFGLHQPRPALALIVAMLFMTIALVMLLSKLLQGCGMADDAVRRMALFCGMA